MSSSAVRCWVSGSARAMMLGVVSRGLAAGAALPATATAAAALSAAATAAATLLAAATATAPAAATATATAPTAATATALAALWSGVVMLWTAAVTPLAAAAPAAFHCCPHTAASCFIPCSAFPAKFGF